MELNVFVFGGIWYHINFRAKAHNADANCTGELFLAELRQADPSRLEVTPVTLLELEKYGDIGCTFCQAMGKQIHHPVLGFIRGAFILETKHQTVGRYIDVDGCFDFERYYAAIYCRPCCPLPLVEPSTKEKEDAARLQCLWNAKRALLYYNQREEEDFQIVEPLISGV